MGQSKAQREAAEKRDDEILRLFIAGATYRQIARALNIGVATVSRTVTKQLAAGAKRRELLSDEALAVHTERTERLFQAHWVKALNGDHRSAEICRRILAQQARINSLDVDTSLPAPTSSAGLTDERDTEDEGPADELSKLRSQRGAS